MLLHRTPAQRIGAEATKAHESKPIQSSIELSNLVMMRIAYDHPDASRCRSPRNFCESFLVRPREITLVVSHEAVVVMRNRIDRIAVDHVTLSSAIEHRLKIAALESRE